MNRDRLKTLLEALKSAIAEIEPELAKPVDPFVVHVYRSRRGYDQETGRKNGKRAEQYAHSTYMRAQELGFRGGPQAWLHILKAFPPSPQEDSERF